MDFLNKAYAQVADLFRSMTPAARITTGLLAGVLVVSLFFLFRSQSSKSQEYLFGGQEYSHSELAAMETAFAKAGLGDSEIVGNRIRVPRGKKNDYLAALADANVLPADFHLEYEKAIKNDSPFTSKQARQKRMEKAKERELSLVVSRMQGIEYGSVYYDESEKQGFPRKREKTAIVAVKAVGNEHLDADRVRAIKNLVSAAYAGLKRENVTVTDMNGGVTFPGIDGDGSSADFDDRYAARKADYEKKLLAKIHDAVGTIPGVKVAVNVTLNPELENVTHSVTYDPTKTVNTLVKESSDESSSNPANIGGRPGAVPNGVRSNVPATLSGSQATETQTTKTSSENRSIASQDHIKTSKAPLTPKQAKATIRVPKSYVMKVWREKNPTPEGEEVTPPELADLQALETEITTEIRDAVIQVMPPRGPLNDPTPQVLVSVFQDLAPPQAVQPGFVDKATVWLAGNWQTLAMIVVGLFSLLLLRGMIRSSLTNEALAQEAASLQMATEEVIHSPEQEEESDEEQDSILGLKRRQPTNAPNLREELTKMVHEDIDAAANVLRNWIGDAA